MERLSALLRVWLADVHEERGATAIEYGLIAALISVAIIGAVTLVGDNLEIVFNEIAGALGI